MAFVCKPKDANFKLPQRTTRSLSKTIMAEKFANRKSRKKKLEVVLEPRLTRSRSRSSLQSNSNFHQASKSCSIGSGSDSGCGTASETCEDVVSPASSRLSISSDSVISSENIQCCRPKVEKLKFGVFDQESTRAGVNHAPKERKMFVLYLQYETVKALVPLSNRSHYEGPFKINIINNTNTYLNELGCNMRIHHVSAVVSLEPSGTLFHDLQPAIIIIPVIIEPKDEDWLCCLFSDTNNLETPNWQRLPKSQYYYKNGNIVITTQHFSLFTVVLEEPFPEILKKIRCRTGGRIRIPDVPGTEVTFPRGCLQHDIDACLRVLFDNEPSFPAARGVHYIQPPLASPIISLGPHGMKFKRDRLPVVITLPVPDYNEIKSRFPTARLAAYQSSTRDGEPTMWQKVNYTLGEPTNVAYRHGITGVAVYTISFPVYHFSFFKVVWELLSTSLYEAKMGVSYFYPFISFSMMCQAFMEESRETNRFGLEVICYRSDRRMPDTTNYRHKVGSSLKPKLVRPGRILVKLRSQMFEADVEAGEESEMAKEEPDFRGRDFEKQYACRFKPDTNIERGTFGKVIVERISNKKDPLFEFNLNKSGVETAEPTVERERWTMFAVKELASSLQITDGNNWKKFAQFIGFTKNEIKNKMQYSADPFLEMVNLYNSRGGTPEEFIQGLYAVSREIAIDKANGTGSPRRDSSMSSRDSAGSGSKASSSQNSKDSPNKPRGFWSFRPWGRANIDSDSAESSDPNKSPEQAAIQPPKKRSRPSTDKKSGESAAKRRKFSDESETIRTSSSEDDEPDGAKSVSTEKHKANVRKLSDRDLWRISAGIVRKDWRNLGRTLGIEENVLLNLEHAHQSVGFRECAYQMLLEWKGRKPKKCTFGELYTALNREKMISVSKFMVRKIAINNNKAGSDSD